MRLTIAALSSILELVLQALTNLFVMATIPMAFSISIGAIMAQVTAISPSKHWIPWNSTSATISMPLLALFPTPFTGAVHPALFLLQVPILPKEVYLAVEHTTIATPSCLVPRLPMAIVSSVGATGSESILIRFSPMMSALPPPSLKPLPKTVKCCPIQAPIPVNKACSM